jgi:hypothetical protein
MRPDQLERRLRERLDALGPAPRAELLHVLMLPDFDRADAIGAYWGKFDPCPCGPSASRRMNSKFLGPSNSRLIHGSVTVSWTRPAGCMR